MSQAKLLLAFSANVEVPVAGEANQKVLKRSTLISSVCSSSDEDSVVDCTPIRKRAEFDSIGRASACCCIYCRLNLCNNALFTAP